MTMKPRPEAYIRDKDSKRVRIGLGEKGTTYGEPNAHLTRWVALDIHDPASGSAHLRMDPQTARVMAEELIAHADMLDSARRRDAV